MLEPVHMLEAAAAEIPASLVPPTRLALLYTLAACRSRAWSWLLLETRMGSQPRQVDALLCLSERRPEVLESFTGGLEVFVPFVREWLNPASELHDVIPLMWFEYDLPLEGARGPFVQFCVDPNYPGKPSREFLDPETVCRVANRALSLIGHPNPEAVEALHRAAAMLPRGSRFLHLGVMPHRGHAALRAIAVLEPAQIPPWLERVGWRGPAGRLDALLALFAPELYVHSLQIDLEPELGPTIALEFSSALEPGPRSPWRAFMDRLVAAGLCRDDVAASALGWVGTRRMDLPHYDWPVHLRRSLSVKVVLDGEGALSAKAYLGLRTTQTLL